MVRNFPLVKTVLLFAAFSYAGLGLCADKSFVVNDHIYMLVQYFTNNLGKGDNQIVSVHLIASEVPVGYRSCANRMRMESPGDSGISYIESPKESEGQGGVLFVAHDPHSSVINDSVWFGNRNGADVRWTMKVASGYYLPSSNGGSGSDDARIIECKKATTAEARYGAQQGVGMIPSPSMDDDPYIRP